MTYAEAIQFLYRLRWIGAKFGLENTRRLAVLTGNPQDRLRFIHVAGTNGKGSTCAMLESIYRTAGLRVGLFTSPHLVSFRERMQVNRQLISEADVVRLVEKLREAERRSPDQHNASLHPRADQEIGAPAPARDACPTFFEFVAVMALKYFAEQKCDLVVWETGLGGRLDATNIVTPLASVITNIGLDHQQWLGDTLAQIAAEKAGIIKPCVPVITGAEGPEALAVIQATALRQRAPMTLVTYADTLLPPLDTRQLPLLGGYQRMNAAVALATVRVLQASLPASGNAILKGLMNLRWPGRFQIAERAPGIRLLLDGAHNPDGALALRAALGEHFPGTRPALILGVMQDKDRASMCEILSPLATRVLCVPVSSERSASPEQLRAACQRANPGVVPETRASLADALAATETEPFTVVAGSLHLVGEAMELLRLTTIPSCDEKPLNEWTLKAGALVSSPAR